MRDDRAGRLWAFETDCAEFTVLLTLDQQDV
jgi:hypothetical protein